MIHRLKCIIGTLIFLCVFAGCVFSVIPGSPLKPGILASLQWLRTVPDGWSALVFTLVQAVAVFLALPATPFNLAAGYMFNAWAGSVVSLASLNLAAIVSFFVGRYLARQWAESQMEKRPAFKAIDAAVGYHGFYIVFLVTLTPVFPSGVCYYVFGVTKVGFVAFIIATMCGLVPGTVALTYIGSLMGDVADIYQAHLTTETTAQRLIWLIVAATTTIATVALLGVITKRALDHAIEMEAANTKRRSKDELEMVTDDTELDNLALVGVPPSAIDPVMADLSNGDDLVMIEVDERGCPQLV